MAKPKTPSAPAAPKPVKPASAPAGIDTSLAAQVAARLVAKRAAIQAARERPAGESAEFKQIKESVSKPHASLLGAALHKIMPASQQPTQAHAAMEKQVGHSQTNTGFNKTGVPRRTATG